MTIRTTHVQELAIAFDRVKQGRTLRAPTLGASAEPGLPNRIRVLEISGLQNPDGIQMFLRQSGRM